MSDTWKNEYKLVKWSSPEELVQKLQEYSDNGFRTELSRVYHEKGDSGWTVFTRGYDIAPQFMNTKISFSELYSVINSTEFKEATKNFDEMLWPYRTTAGDVLDAKLKAYYARQYPDAEEAKLNAGKKS